MYSKMARKQLIRADIKASIYDLGKYLTRFNELTHSPDMVLLFDSDPRDPSSRKIYHYRDVTLVDYGRNTPPYPQNFERQTVVGTQEGIEDARQSLESQTGVKLEAEVIRE